MKFLQQRRLELGWSQGQLASQCLVSRQRIADFEGEVCLPTPSVANKLESSLNLKAIPSIRQVLSASKVRKLLRLKPFEVPAVSPESWSRMASHWPHLLRKLSAPPAVIAWMRRFVLADSGTECLADAQLAAAGATPGWANPHTFGFRRQPIVDAQGLALGERYLPCLHWKTQDFESIVWPQVTLRPGAVSYRVDYLALLRVGRHLVWLVIEIDGPRHDPTYDKFRAQELGLEHIRISAEDVKKLRFIEILKSEFQVIATTGRPSQPAEL